MTSGVFDTVREWLRSPEEEYEVEEYVLSRRQPDPENRIRVYDSPREAHEVEEDMESLPPGIYILQEIKSNGMAGDVVWEEEIGEE